MQEILAFISNLNLGDLHHVPHALAQIGVTNFGTENLNNLLVYSTRNIYETVSNIINIILSFLGALAILFILYGGFIWLTSQGDKDKIQRAKLIIVSAVVGILIIFSAYALSRFIIERLGSATGITTEEPGPGPIDPSQPSCDEPTDVNEVRICQVSPYSAGLGSAVTISGWHFGSAMGTVTFDDHNGHSAQAEIATCSGETTWSDRSIVAVIPTSLVPGGGYYITVHNVTLNADGIFPELGPAFTITDSTNPSIFCLSPDIGPIGATINVEGSGFGATPTANDDVYIDFANSPQSLILPSDASDISTWTDNLITFNIPSTALSGNVQVRLNNAVNISNPQFLTVSCTSDSNNSTECPATNCCAALQCRPSSICLSGSEAANAPAISSITPNNGAGNNLITIQGRNFGSIRGQVTFYSPTGSAAGILPSTLNSECSNADTWTDNYIIIGVPNTLANGSLNVEVTTAAPTLLVSAPATFLKNDINRPGICLADKTSGTLETPVTITGINFTNNTGDRVTYSGTPGYNIAINTTLDKATSTVPSLQPDSVGIQINSGTELSNPYPFLITPALSGRPVISEIDPPNGPRNQYLTIRGANFGSYVSGQSQVLFDSTQGMFTFPVQCLSTFWRDDQIIVKVPNTLANATYQVRVVRSDSRESDARAFVVNSNTLRPGLCALSPNNGQPGNQVDLIGDNFGNSVATVSYHENQSVTDFSSPNFWVNSQIRTRVPDNAQSGPVRVLLAATSSNSLNFSVGTCGSNSDCQALGYTTCCPRDVGNYCANSCETVRSCTYGWRIVTQAAPITELGVLNQWPSCTDSCNNAQIGIRFNSALREDTVLTSNFSIRDITNGLPGTVVTISSLSWNRTDNSIVLNYNGNLTLGHTYEVSILPGLQNIDNDGFDETYSWPFMVGSENCQFSSVEVRPSDFTATRPNQVIDYSAAPRSDIGICGGQPLTCSNCQWDWSSTQTNIATIGTNAQYVNAVSTGSTTNLTGSTNISCAVSQVGSTPPSPGQGILNINYTLYVGTLSVTNWWPNCNGACINSQVRVDFSSPLSPGSITAANFRITNAGGDLVSDGNLTPINGNRSVIIGHEPFTLSQTYTLIVNAAVANTFGATLGANFEQTFFTASNPADCRVSSIDVTPQLEPDYGFVATQRNQSIRYEALTFGSNDSCTNIPIDCTNCSYAWDTIESVATVSPTTSARPYITVSPSANNGDFTSVDAYVTDLGITSSNSDLLSISLYQGPTPEIAEYEPPQGSTSQCLNAAISVTFTELMNAQSLRDGIRVEDVTNAASPVAVSGSLSISSVAGRTKAVFNPQTYLLANRTYRVVVANTVASIENVNLAAEFSWTFGTGTEICRISYAIIEPSQEVITCASNNCLDDINIAADGNQHEYHVSAYDVRGTLLSSTGLDFSWRTKNSPPNNLLDFVFGSNADTLLATVINKNGEEILIVDVIDGDLTDQINLGQVSVSANITIFLCENPWPDLNTFPWAPFTVAYDYNFSTYYCQSSGISGGTVLPSLNIPLPTNPTPAGVLPSGEFIFTVNPSITMQGSSSFGSLALAEPDKNPIEKTGQNWLRLLSKIFIPRVIGQEIPVNSPSAPTNLTAVSATASGVSLTWTDNSGGSHQESGFIIERREVSTGNTISITLPADSTSYIDRSAQVNLNYTYRVGATSDATTVIFWGSSIAVSIASDQTGIDIIGIRVMGNPEHLSVSDWYKKTAPNPNQVGNLIEVDGYEAMQVGNTVYMAATNLSGGALYTNIYILAYNVGARSYTQEIVRQMLANFKFNVNIQTGQSNLCRFDGILSTQSCSSDFDCVHTTSSYTCDSLGLKLRRDVERLGDLLSVKQSIDNYGLAHKACSNNSQINCLADNQCPSGGRCAPYYPMLNAGTFIRGQSNSKWPSWQETFSSTLGKSLPVDPINQFNGCLENGFDPDTCWNESTLTFNCPTNSLLYYYRRNDTGSSYSLSANFEYDRQAWFGITFYEDLVNVGSTRGVQAPLSSTLTNICNGTSANASNPSCGNGIIDTVDGVTEQCDGGYLDNRCDATLTNQAWWNEQKFGCNPPGTLSATGTLIECQWYAPATPLTATQCGGYCRNNHLETAYERCEVISGSTSYNNIIYNCGTGYTLTCSSSSCQPICTLLGSNYPAAACGDGVWTEGVEQCDGSANPSGLGNWDCTENGNARCDNTCHTTCDVGLPYLGRCGDGIIQNIGICSNNSNITCVDNSQCSGGTCVQTERCDYAGFLTPTPNQADGAPAPAVNVAYTCSQSCDFVNQPYCGDLATQGNFGEICDTTLAVRPTPIQSGVNNQYSCRMTIDPANSSYNRCTPTIDGWCGDGLVQDGQNGTVNAGEQCDSLNYSVTPDESSLIRQYACSDGCQTSGGYCGDGTLQSIYGEACDYGSSPIQKSADVVFVFDMSASMATAADNFCDSLNSVITSLQNNDVNFRLTIMPLGDSPSNNLTPSTADNINTIFTVDEFNSDGSNCGQYSYYIDIQLPGAVNTFNTLVSNCTLPAVSAPNTIRVRSFYDTSNDIATSVVANNCTDMTYPATGMCVVQDEYAGNIENWAYATAKVAEAYNWISGYQRIIVPVSDEYAWCGGNATIFTNDDNYGPGVTGGWLYDAVQLSRTNNIHISPVFLNTYTPAVEAATNVANDTGGNLITSNIGWDTNIMRIVNSAFCDGNGDGIMDCTLPNN